MSNQSNVVPLRDFKRDLRRARAQFVDEAIKADGRTGRYVALQIGMNPSTMSERLRGKNSFLADELEGIAHVLKIDPVEFYRQYISITPDNPNPQTLVPKVGGWDSGACKIESHASVAQGIEHWFPVPAVARSNRVGGTLIAFPIHKAGKHGFASAPSDTRKFPA